MTAAARERETASTSGKALAGSRRTRVRFPALPPETERETNMNATATLTDAAFTPYHQRRIAEAQARLDRAVAFQQNHGFLNPDAPMSDEFRLEAARLEAVRLLNQAIDRAQDELEASQESDRLSRELWGAHKIPGTLASWHTGNQGCDGNPCILAEDGKPPVEGVGGPSMDAQVEAANAALDNPAPPNTGAHDWLDDPALRQPQPHDRRLAEVAEWDDRTGGERREVAEAQAANPSSLDPFDPELAADADRLYADPEWKPHLASGEFIRWLTAYRSAVIASLESSGFSYRLNSIGLVESSSRAESYAYDRLATVCRKWREKAEAENTTADRLPPAKEI